MSILVVYASKHGGTEGIAKRIAETLRREGHSTTVSPAVDGESPLAYQAVVLGSAVYFGAWLKEAVTYVRRNRAALNMRPVWLFSSGPLEQSRKERYPQPAEYAQLRDSLQAREHRIFLGALDAGKLSLPESMLAKAIGTPVGDFRDWAAIEAWAQGIGRAISHIAVVTSMPA